MISSKCPFCSCEFEVEDEMIGRRGQCYSCGNKFTIEALSARPVAAEGGPSEPVVASPAPAVRQVAPPRPSDRPLTPGPAPRALPLAGMFVLAVLVIGGGLAWGLRGVFQATQRSERLEAAEASPSDSPAPDLAAAAASPAPAVPAPPPDPPFSFDDWRTRYGATKPIAGWKTENPFPWSNYFDGRSAACAAGWFIQLGPIGARVYFHDATWDPLPAFRDRCPPFLRDGAGLVTNAMEVVAVAVDGPAAGHLQPGDLITEVDGQALLPSQLMYPDREVLVRDTRGLEIHAGRLIDAAEGRGRVRLKVIRPPGWTNVWTSAEINRAAPEAEFGVDVGGMAAVRLVVRHTAANHDHCWANWIEPEVVTDTGERLPLSTRTWTRAVSGWGEVRAGRNIDNREVVRNGRTVGNMIGTHANSEIEFPLPPGARRLTGIAQLGGTHDRGLIASIEVKPRVVATYPPRSWRGLAEGAMMTREERARPLELDAPLGGAAFFRLVATDGGNGNGSDHLRLEGVVLRDAAGREVPLDRLVNTVRDNGYGAVRVEAAENVWRVHAPCVFEYRVPAGGPWTLRGRVAANDGATITARAEALDPAAPAPELAALTREVEFDLPRIGSFGERFDPEGEKARHYRALLAERIAVQQGEDGSWGGVNSYTTPVFHTSMCALGLMAQADPRHEGHIRKAAEYVAASAPDLIGGWSYPQGVAILFLSEYYLRTRDASVLPALERAIVGVRPNIHSDHTAGHGLVPGYGGHGWIGGGGMITCGLAVAARTPVRMEDPGLVDRMLDRIQELAPDGQMPYGREAARATYLDDPEVDRGQGWSSGTGPYFLGALVRGGTDYFVRAVRKRYAQPPWGDADAGHASHMLPFVWACLGVANCGPEAHRGNMEAFLWKFTLNRDFDGFINRNTNRLEYHGAEDVIGNPYWGMGGYLMIFNAHRRNLAITGQPDLVAASYRSAPVRHDGDQAFWRSTVRDWNIVEAVLGPRAPAGLAPVLERLRGLPQDADLGAATFALLRQHAPPLARQVAALDAPEVRDPLRQQLAEMLLGIEVQVMIGRRYREDKKPGDEGQIRIQVRNPHGFWREALPKEERKVNPLPATDLTGRIVLRDPAGKFLRQPVTFDFTPEKKRFDTTVTGFAEDRNIPLVAEVRYRAGDLEFAYARPLVANSDDPMREFVNLRKVWVSGRMDRDTIGHSLPFRLPNGQLVGAADREACDMVWREKSRTYRKSDRGFLTRGTPCRFLVSSGDYWEAIVHELAILDPDHGVLTPDRLAVVAGDARGAALTPLADGDWTSGVEIEPDAAGKVALEWTFARPAAARALELRVPQDAGYVLELRRAGAWEFWGSGRVTKSRKLLLLPVRTADGFRMTLAPARKGTVRIDELRLHGG